MSTTTSHESLTALSSCMLGLSTIALGLRFYMRGAQKAPLKADDWILLPTLILLAATIGCGFYGIQRQVVGYPTPGDTQLVAKQAAMLSKLYIAFDFFSMATLGGIKISALLFYHRIFCVTGRSSIFRSLIFGSIVVVILWTIAYMILAGLQCGTHFPALWDGTYLEYCHISYPFLLSFAISDFILDFWIIALPVPQVWRIKTTWHRRFAIMGVFLLALVGFGGCMGRLVVYVQLNHDGPAAHVDKRLVNTKSIWLSVLEIGLSYIAVNLPSLWSLFNKVIPEDILRSVRSMISLQSIRSRVSSNHKISPRSTEISQTNKADSIRATSSESYLVRSGVAPVETHAMHDFSKDQHFDPEDHRDVYVTRTITQSSQRVGN